jgi:hypothetical protein
VFKAPLDSQLNSIDTHRRHFFDIPLIILSLTASVSFIIIYINYSGDKMRWEGYVARMEDRRGIYRVLVGKPEGNRPLGRPRRGWEDNIRMDL